MSLSAIPQDPIIDCIHGVIVADPYRWLEDRHSTRTEEWIAHQAEIHDAYFSDIERLQALESRVADYLNTEIVDQPAQIGNFQFFRRRERNRQQGRIWVRDVSTGEERYLVDPYENGPFASVGIHRISADGSLLAYELRYGGEDAGELHVVNHATGKTIPDYLPRGYPRGFTFTPDLAGFYYCHEIPGASGDHTIRLHLLGNCGQDRVVFRAPRTDTSRLILISDQQNLGAIYLHGQGSEVLIDFSVASQGSDIHWRRVFADERIPHTPVLKGGRIFIFTNKGTRYTRIVEITQTGAFYQDIVPEWRTDIREFTFAGGYIYLSYFIDQQTSIRSYSLKERDTRHLDVPTTGSIRLLPTFVQEANTLFYTYESFTEPLSIYQVSPGIDGGVLWWSLASRCSTDSYEIQKIMIPAKDGTLIPLSLVRRKMSSNDFPKPVIMTAYGGFGVLMTPKFSVLVTIMLDLGAVFALPNIRGGCEFGKAWHEAARGRKRQVACDDFISVAEWLCREGVTTGEQLAIFGGSNSGLLVGAAMTQRPELFRAVLCIAPLLDMVRYEHFNEARKWRHEYGTVEDKEDFHALYSYSPYHRIKSNLNYPSTLFVVGDKDDRCNPAHVRKMAARLQDRDVQIRPILVDHCSERGHSPVMPLGVRIQALARRLAFLCKELKIQILDGDYDEPVCL